MKKILLTAIIILVLALHAANAEHAQEMICGGVGDAKEIVLNAKSCNVEFEHSKDGNVKCQYDDDAISITYTFENNAFWLNLNGKYDQAEKRRSVHLYLPFESFERFVLDAADSNIAMGLIMTADLHISAYDASYIDMEIRSSQSRHIEITMQNNSALLLAVGEEMDNFKIDASVKDDTNYLRMGMDYPEFSRQGEYHYKRGSEETTIHIEMEDKCRFELRSIE